MGRGGCTMIDMDNIMIKIEDELPDPPEDK